MLLHLWFLTSVFHRAVTYDLSANQLWLISYYQDLYTRDKRFHSDILIYPIIKVHINALLSYSFFFFFFA